MRIYNNLHFLYFMTTANTNGTKLFCLSLNFCRSFVEMYLTFLERSEKNIWRQLLACTVTFIFTQYVLVITHYRVQYEKYFPRNEENISILYEVYIYTIYILPYLSGMVKLSLEPVTNISRLEFFGSFERIQILYERG